MHNCYRSIINYFLEVVVALNGRVDMFKNIVSDELFQIKYEYKETLLGKYYKIFIYLIMNEKMNE